MNSPLNSNLLHSNSRCGTSLTNWLATIGGKGLDIALHDPSTLIPMIKKADLRGLGGSGYPTHRKWHHVANQAHKGDRYLVCNGNEDEPGTFKDCKLLEETPHQVIEGAIISALATGINCIIFYINPAQENSLRNIRLAITQWESSHYITAIETVLKRPLSFRIMASSGHYIGGEETAAIESIEGHFPFPRGKPPFPAERGIHNQPTLVNNIETLANVSHIARNGAQWYRDLGLGQACGTKLYCLSGEVLSPGVYELPMGTPLRDLIFEYGGGMHDDKKIKAVFTGGPSNSILTANDLDVSLDFDSVMQRRASLGTGAMIVISEDERIVKHVSKYINFFAQASCGQCPPCKTGTHYMALLLAKFNCGQANREDLNMLISLSKILPDSGRCHLPNGATRVLESSLTYFMDEYERALETKI